MLLTTGEKERIFMDSIQSFYYNQRQLLTDDDFDKLKEDLSWEGSQVRSSRLPSPSISTSLFYLFPSFYWLAVIG